MTILVIVGTKAQFIKTAPLLREMDDQGIAFRLVYTGQHSETFSALEQAFGTRPADDVLVPFYEADTKASFLRWACRFWWEASRRIVKGGWKGMRVAVVHGDTASTLLGACAARLAGVKVAHVEAGLRSTRLLDPFPEELVRRILGAMARVHYVPDEIAQANLAAARGAVINTMGNTLKDALLLALSRIQPVPDQGGAGGYAVVSIHRNENLSSRSNLSALMWAIIDAAKIIPIKFVLHPATRSKIAKTKWGKVLEATPEITLLERMDYPSFIELLLRSKFLMTDGGSNQEEAAMLGLPTILLRRATERMDGLGDTVVLSCLDSDLIRDFVVRNARATWAVRVVTGPSPSKHIADSLRSI